MNSFSKIGVPVPREYSSIDNNSEDGCEATSEQSQQEKRINHLDTSTPSQQKEARKQRKELDVLGTGTNFKLLLSFT
jgi:hypothetical protein